MGLKSGSRDAGLDDSDEEETETEEQGETETGDVPESAPETETDAETTDDGSDDRPTMDSIPYKLRRNKVNEGRDQVPFFLREEVIDDEQDLQSELEAILGEDVYKSDYREAAMVVAQRNPGLVAEVLREWGYDLDAT